MANHETNEQKIIQIAKNLFKTPCTFVAGAQNIERIPQYPFPEVSFWGRSNVGKSSLLNGLFGTSVARTSNTPGRTQQLNFFNLSDKLIFVDMPGYGFANVPLKIKYSWEELISTYLEGRDQLKCLYLLIDARHGFKANDIEMMNYLNQIGCIYQVVVTKTDKISLAAHQKIKEAMEETLKNHGAALPSVILTSAERKQGIYELQQSIAKVAITT